MRVIAIGNQKGGVGKTSVAVNLSAALALSGEPTLLVDMDPQAAASDSLGFVQHKDPTLTVAHWYRNPEPLQAGKHIFETQLENLFLFPNSMDSMEAAISIARDPTPSTFIQRFLKCPAIRDRFSYVVIDTPPNLDCHFNNSIMAADFLLIPVSPELKTVRGLMNLQPSLVKLAEASSVRVLGMILSMVQANLNTHKRVTDFIDATYGDLVFKTQIMRSKDFPETDEFGRLSILNHAPGSKGAEAIMSLTEEVLKRIGEVSTGRRSKPKLWDGKINRAFDALAETL